MGRQLLLIGSTSDDMLQLKASTTPNTPNANKNIDVENMMGTERG
jgi:hypothetical protein